MNTKLYETDSLSKYLKNKVTSLSPEITNMNEKIEAIYSSFTKQEEKYEQLSKDMIMLDHQKLSLEAYKLESK